MNLADWGSDLLAESLCITGENAAALGSQIRILRLPVGMGERAGLVAEVRVRGEATFSSTP